MYCSKSIITNSDYLIHNEKKWRITNMNDRASMERDLILEAKSKGKLATWLTFLRLSGPGWLLSAITLGGGSLSGALFLGVIGGYEFLWVQLVAMVMGVIMLAAISYVTLSTEKSPFKELKNNINPVLAWGWLIATLMANLVWILPQFSLAYAAISQNLMPDTFANLSGNGPKYLVSIVLLVPVLAITLAYGRGGLGIKIYELILKIVVAAIVLCFIGVVVKLITVVDDFSMTEVFVGFIPDFGTWFRPASIYEQYLSGLSPEQADYWREVIIREQRTRLIGAAAAAVGINMTFLFPMSMLSKGWGKDHRELAIFDVSTGMVIPFVIAVSCVVIASAYMFHGKPYEGLIDNKDGVIVVNEDNKGYGSFKKYISARENNTDLSSVPVNDTEKQIASFLINRDTGAFANALSTLTSDKKRSNIIFGLGVLAMALSTISMLILISGFALTEAFNAPRGGLVHKLGILTGITGILWPIWWSGKSLAFLAVITSTIGYILLPIAFLAFIIMMNSKKILGDDVPKGSSKIIWNTLMGISFAITGSAAFYTAQTKVLFGFPIGVVGLSAFIVLVVFGQIYMMKKNRSN